MVAEEEGAQTSTANGVADDKHMNGVVENGGSDHGNTGRKLTATEKKKLKKKQRKANKQAAR